MLLTAAWRHDVQVKHTSVALWAIMNVVVVSAVEVPMVGAVMQMVLVEETGGDSGTVDGGSEG